MESQVLRVKMGTETLTLQSLNIAGVLTQTDCLVYL
jgi:hypothetical protein